VNFKPYLEAYHNETNYRGNIDASKLCDYGIKPLNDAMVAIAPNELIVIAAASGYGKTELSLAISRHNAMNGKKVAHYHLEGGYIEAIQRMKWRDICDLYYSIDEYRSQGIELDFRKWSLNKNVHPLLSRIESLVYANLKEKLKGNLYLYDRPEGLTCDDFLVSLLEFNNLKTAFGDTQVQSRKMGFELDLIIIDHLQYFSLENEKDEIQEVTKIMKEAKRITDFYGIPIILVSHLRKLPRQHGMPDKEDIYGTGNIHKIANTCIIIHPHHESDKSGEGLYPTFMRVAKSRIGIRPSDLIYVDFDIYDRKYRDRYSLIKGFPDGSFATEPMFLDQCPKWYDGDKIMRVKNEERNIG